MRIKYAEDVIVGINDDIGFRWYITDRDPWILDIDKYCDAYRKIGHEVNLDFILSLRNNIAVINENSYKEYLNMYKEDVVDSTQLKKQIINKDFQDTILELKPSIYIDFTKKILLSMYPENIPFEKYVPEGWLGRREDFTQYIPSQDRYWCIKGVNMIDKLFGIEMKKFKGETIDE